MIIVTCIWEDIWKITLWREIASFQAGTPREISQWQDIQNRHDRHGGPAQGDTHERQ